MRINEFLKVRRHKITQSTNKNSSLIGTGQADQWQSCLQAEADKGDNSDGNDDADNAGHHDTVLENGDIKLTYK